MTQVTIRNSRLAATIAARGAELCSLVPDGGTEVMWSGDPAVWPWHAPNLFPIVGALADDILIHDGKRYCMKQHGFLRHSDCAVISAEAESCEFCLCDSAATREQYPFAFALTIRYRLVDDRLDISFDLHNPDRVTLYASIGAHPAFRWPLNGAPRETHVVVFDQPEQARIRRLAGRSLDKTSFKTPVNGRVLRLKDSLFERDAIIFDALVSRKLVFGAPGGPGIELDFSDFPYFGIWSKPGGKEFLCLEPWQGYASPAGFSGEFAEKPGIVALAAGETRSWRYAIRPMRRMPEIAP